MFCTESCQALLIANCACTESSSELAMMGDTKCLSMLSTVQFMRCEDTMLWTSSMRSAGNQRALNRTCQQIVNL